MASCTTKTNVQAQMKSSIQSRRQSGDDVTVAILFHSYYKNSHFHNIICMCVHSMTGCTIPSMH